MENKNSIVINLLLIPILIFNLMQFLLADDMEILLNAEENLKIYKPFDCDNLVDEIQEDSRRYLVNDGYSIEQIEFRKIVDETDELIECNGTAVLSNTLRENINYKAYVDVEGDWIIKYSLY